MPTYEYKCKSCGHEMELFQSMKDAPKRKCPACKKNTLERLIGLGAAVLFKGSGFYQTDYRSESYKKSAESDKPAEAKGDGKTESKSEGKTEGKSESSGSKAESKSESKPVEKKPAAQNKPEKTSKPTKPKDAA